MSTTKFIKLPIKRGFEEIKPFYDICEKHEGIICGGYARFAASPLTINKVVFAGDVDIFPKSEEASIAIAEAVKVMGYKIKHENHISITMTLENDKGPLAELPIPQIIKPVIEGKIVTLGTAEEILDNFDFTITRAAILSPTEVLVDEDFIKDEKKKILRLKNIHCPISSLLRCCKYSRKGYFMRPAEALKLFQDWVNRGEEYQTKIIEFFLKSAKGKVTEDNPDGMTQEDIDELESLLHID